jgi:hypothetical protein
MLVKGAPVQHSEVWSSSADGDGCMTVLRSESNIFINHGLDFVEDGVKLLADLQLLNQAVEEEWSDSQALVVSSSFLPPPLLLFSFFFYFHFVCLRMCLDCLFFSY